MKEKKRGHSKDVQIGVRMSREDYDKLVPVARANKCGPSTFVRRLVLEALGIENKLILPPTEAPAPSFKIPAHGTPGRRRRWPHA